MKTMMKNKTVWLTAVAVILAGSMTIHGAMAYFTANASASGGHNISLGERTEITEDFSDWTKHIVIGNTGTNDCYVRVKAYCGSQFTIDYSQPDGTAWSQGEGEYWYYSDIVPVGGQTSVLDAKITVPEEFKDNFNVVVIQECAAVLYDADGNPYADWSQKIDQGSGSGGEEAGK